MSHFLRCLSFVSACIIVIYHYFVTTSLYPIGFIHLLILHAGLDLNLKLSSDNA